MQVAVDQQLARCPAAAAPHPATLSLSLSRFLARSYLPAARPEGCIELQGLVLHLQDAAEAEARLQPWLLGRSEHSAEASSILPELPQPQPDRPLLRLHSVRAELASNAGTLLAPGGHTADAGPEQQPSGLTAREQGSCQVSSSGLGLHLHADALLGALSVAAAAKAVAQQLKQRLEPHLRAEAAQAALSAAESAAEQGSSLPAAAATAAVAVAEQQGTAVSEPGKPASKLRALASSTALGVQLQDSRLAMQMADDVTWTLTVHELCCGLRPGQLPSAELQGLGVHLNHSALLTAHSIDLSPLHIAGDVYPSTAVQPVPGASFEEYLPLCIRVYLTDLCDAAVCKSDKALQCRSRESTVSMAQHARVCLRYPSLPCMAHGLPSWYMPAPSPCSRPCIT